MIFTLLANVTASAACLSDQEALKQVSEWVKVAKVVDGDTVHLTDGRKIRFIGINTPEIGRHGEASEPFAQQAYRFLKNLLSQHDKIGLSYDREKKDRYKRLLAYITLPDGRSVEQIMLEQGLAFSIAVPPNIKQLTCFRTVESRARHASRGLWQLKEMQSRAARDLSSKAKGYRLVSGKVSNYSESKNSIYLKLTDRLSVRIFRKDLNYFSSLPLKSLVGKNIEVRGWVSHYKGRQSISVRTPLNIQRVEQD